MLSDELDLIKLEDGVRIHEDTRVALDIYSRNNNIPLVKPFILVVAQNTEHSGRLKDLIASRAFFDGRYAGKVMEINSSQAGSEKEENIERLLNLESIDNQTDMSDSARNFPTYGPEGIVQEKTCRGPIRLCGKVER